MKISAKYAQETIAAKKGQAKLRLCWKKHSAATETGAATSKGEDEDVKANANSVLMKTEHGDTGEEAEEDNYDEKYGDSSDDNEDEGNNEEEENEEERENDYDEEYDVHNWKVVSGESPASL
ncbi:acidic leucine-rich nuclear phosphoprotein 32 family member B-like [Schistocerca nitens]|uniref:acidic leucine-rich nuclear phosphoprotein 32 family member B-like n=1 Tax=Schistocerca nitens TaxID=7011 RepID=UPI0021186685|nr:acidic leucine-rich nuclear phosphoprotein 32 family member B-like [Schistocerca nitens]